MAQLTENYPKIEHIGNQKLNIYPKNLPDGDLVCES